jgi:hypothetical protein
LLAHSINSQLPFTARRVARTNQIHAILKDNRATFSDQTTFQGFALFFYHNNVFKIENLEYISY